MFPLLIVGIAGAMGTGLIFSRLGMVAIAGPESILSWILGLSFMGF